MSAPTAPAAHRAAAADPRRRTVAKGSATIYDPAVTSPPIATDSPHRLADSRRVDVWNPCRSAWQRLCPNEVPADPVLASLEAYLDEPETRAELWRLEAAEEYPQPVLDGMCERGLMQIFGPSADDPAGSRVTPWHLSALNALDARRDQSLAVTISVNGLGLLPAWVAANPQQLERIHARVAEGTFSSLLLSELSHGSNLLRNEAQAERGTLGEDGAFVPVADGEPCTHYRLSGEKDLINGANEHGLLFTFLRTRNLDRRGADFEPLQARADFSMFWLERQDDMEPLPRWRTLPARGADISGVRFNQAVVSAEHLLGREHGGMNIAQKTLILSRGGVASLASGCLSRARDLARHYASQRAIYGPPIHELGAIADHLLRLEALDRIVSAVAVRTTAMLNRVGLGAAHYTAVAKVIACEFAEIGVREGQRVLGARSLLREAPYERLLREVVLYGVFDGTSHVMLQELSYRLNLEARRAATPNADTAPPADTLDQIREIYLAPPEPVLQSLARRQNRLLLPLEQHLRALAALPGTVDLEPAVALCDLLFDLVRKAEANGAWTADQGVRLDAAQLMATIEALAATIELCDLERRDALGLPPLRGGATDLDPLVYHFAIRWLGARVAAGLRDLALRTAIDAADLECDDLRWPGLDGVELALGEGHRDLMVACRQAL